MTVSLLSQRDTGVHWQSDSDGTAKWNFALGWVTGDELWSCIGDDKTRPGGFRSCVVSLDILIARHAVDGEVNMVVVKCQTWVRIF